MHNKQEQPITIRPLRGHGITHVQITLSVGHLAKLNAVLDIATATLIEPNDGETEMYKRAAQRMTEMSQDIAVPLVEVISVMSMLFKEANPGVHLPKTGGDPSKIFLHLGVDK